MAPNMATFCLETATCFFRLRPKLVAVSKLKVVVFDAILNCSFFNASQAERCKKVPVQAWTGPEGCKWLSVPDC